MKIFKIIFPFFFIVFSFNRCELYSDVLHKPEYKPSLAVHAFLSPELGIKAEVNYTVPQDSVGEQPVPELPALRVFLLQNGNVEYQLEEYGDGSYGLDPSDLEVAYNTDYRIRVEDHTGTVLLESGTDQLPLSPAIEAARYFQDTTTFPESNFLEISLDNSKPDYNVFDIRRHYSIDSGRTFRPARDPQYGIFSYNSLIDAREHDKGADIDQTIKTATFLRPEPGESGIFINVLKVEVSHLSPELTRFFKDLEGAQEIYGEPFATKRPVYSNISGGYGIFGIYNQTDTVLFLER